VVNYTRAPTGGRAVRAERAKSYDDNYPPRRRSRRRSGFDAMPISSAYLNLGARGHGEDSAPDETLGDSILRFDDVAVKGFRRGGDGEQRGCRAW